MWLAARQGKDFARLILAVWVIFGAAMLVVVPAASFLFGVAGFLSLISGMGLYGSVLFFIQPVLQIIALVYVFSSSSNEWFLPNNGKLIPENPDGLIANRTWTTVVPVVNTISLIIYTVAVFGFNLYIVFKNHSFRGEWYGMLGVFAVFVLFVILENFVFKKHFATTPSKHDKVILTIIVIRNILILVNAIPFIRLVALIIGLYGGWLLVPVYVLLIMRKYKQRVV